MCYRSLARRTFDVLRSVVFFYIKTPLRVKEAGLEELIPTTWWPTRFDKEVRSGSPPTPADAVEVLGGVFSGTQVTPTHGRRQGCGWRV